MATTPHSWQDKHLSQGGIWVIYNSFHYSYGHLFIVTRLCNIYSLLNMSVKVKVLVTQLCPALCDPVDCSRPGSSVHGILQARILEWLAILFGSF